MFKRNLQIRSVRRLLVTGNVAPTSPILVILMIEALDSSQTSDHAKLHAVTSAKTAAFTVTAVET
jgi:hypothetical protein